MFITVASCTHRTACRLGAVPITEFCGSIAIVPVGSFLLVASDTTAPFHWPIVPDDMPADWPGYSTDFPPPQGSRT